MLDHKYLVEYHITRAMNGYGEFSKEQVVEKHSMLSVSNDIGEIFTDLFDLHRSSDIVGIEIFNVSETSNFEWEEEEFSFHQ